MVHEPGKRLDGPCLVSVCHGWSLLGVCWDSSFLAGPWWDPFSLAGPCWDSWFPCWSLLGFVGSLRNLAGICWILAETLLEFVGDYSFEFFRPPFLAKCPNHRKQRYRKNIFHILSTPLFFRILSWQCPQIPARPPQIPARKNRTQQIPQGFRKTQQLSTRPQPIPDGADQSKVVQGEIQQEKTISKKRQQQHASSYLYPVALWLEPTQAQANTQAQTQARAQAKITGRSHGPSQGPG